MRKVFPRLLKSFSKWNIYWQGVDEKGKNVASAVESMVSHDISTRIDVLLNMALLMNPKVVLASKSSARRRMLEAAGVAFEIDSADIDEPRISATLEAGGANPRSIAAIIASEKARTVSCRHPGARTVGSDQVLEFEGRTYGKCRSKSELAFFLRMLSGRRHMLHSAAAVCVDGVLVWRQTATAIIKMNSLSDAAVRASIGRLGQEALDNAGGYKAEDDEEGLISGIDGDMNVVLGMPLLELLGYLGDGRV